MKKVLTLAVAGLLMGSIAFAEKETDKKGSAKVPAALDFKMKKLDGKPVDLKDYKGKVVLFVNVASQCGLTPQYEGLQALHEKYAEKGLAIIGVPANEFGAQEPGTDVEISQFCKENYGVKFDMLSKVVVKGDGICPLYKHLTSKETSKFPGEIKWNFTKFLVSRDGEIVNRFEPRTEPEAEEVVKAIEAELEKKAK